MRTNSARALGAIVSTLLAAGLAAPAQGAPADDEILRCRALALVHIGVGIQPAFWMDYLKASAAELRSHGQTTETIRERTKRSFVGLTNEIQAAGSDGAMTVFLPLDESCRARVAAAQR